MAGSTIPIATRRGEFYLLADAGEEWGLERRRNWLGQTQEWGRSTTSSFKRRRRRCKILESVRIVSGRGRGEGLEDGVKPPGKGEVLYNVGNVGGRNLRLNLVRKGNAVVAWKCWDAQRWIECCCFPCTLLWREVRLFHSW